MTNFDTLLSSLTISLTIESLLYPRPFPYSALLLLLALSAESSV